MSAYYDYISTGDGSGYTGADVLPGDAREFAATAPFVPPVAQASGMSPWEAMALYGISRAVDAHFTPPAVMGNTAPGYFAGQNGQTFAPGRPGQMAPNMSAPAAGSLTISPLMLLAIGGLAWAVLK